MLDQNFIWVALAITVFGSLFYIRDTLKGETQPNRVTFFLWGAVPLISFFAQRSAGGGKQILYTLIISVVTFAIFASSFVNKKAYWKITKSDLSCGALSLVALAFLLFTGKPLLALGLSVVADLSAGLPTLIKCYRFPDSETALAYGFDVLAATIVLLTIHHWIFVNFFFSAYILFMNSMFTLLLVFSPKKRIVVD